MSPRLDRVLALAAFGLALAIAGCGGADDPPDREGAAAGAHRPWVDFGEELGDPPPPRATVALTPTAEIAPWSVQGGGEVSFGPVDMPQATEAPALRVADASGCEVVIPGPFDVESFNRVRVTMITAPGAQVRFELRRGGQVVARAPILIHPQSLRPETLDAVLVGGVAGDAPIDELVIAVGPRAGVLNVYGVQLVRESPREWLPTPEAPDLVFLEDDGRRAIGVPVDSTLIFELPDEAGDTLHFVHGALAEHWAVARNATFRLTVEDAGGEARVFERRADQITPDRWQRERLDLSGLGRGREGTIALVGGAGTGPCTLAVGEVLVTDGAPKPPTVLLITSDTHRADHVGAARMGVVVDTPNLDAIAERGVLFERAWSTSCITVPSHSALLTGHHPVETGVYTNASILPAEFETLAERFAAAGYATFGATSARHVSHDYSGLGRGFDRYSAPLLQISRPVPDTCTVLEDWLKEVPDLPVFVWLHVFDAHGPYIPPPPFGRAYVEAAKDDGHIAVTSARYRGEVDWVDSALGQILKAPRFDDAIVCVTSDHGESLGEHGIEFAHTSVYPDSIHVPLLMAWPGAPAGERISDRVRQRDVGRTLLSLAGLPEDGFPGRVLIDGPEPSPTPLYAINANGKSASITDGDDHLMLSLEGHHLMARGQGPFIEQHTTELYDLAVDPWAFDDQVEQRPDRARVLRARLIEWLVAAPPKPDVAGGGSRPGALMADLEALGYAVVDGSDAGQPWIDPDCACAWCAKFE